KLPPGWEKRCFYFNRITGKRQFERPSD
nr:Chain A, Designed protein [synthetic construct]2MDW_B Chain B, Designed protein [synthetic construct]